MILRPPELPNTPLRTRFLVNAAVMLFLLLVVAFSAIFFILSATAAFDHLAEEVMEETEPVLHLQAAVLAVPSHQYLAHGRFIDREQFARLIEHVDEDFAAVAAAPFKMKEERQLAVSAEKEWAQVKEISEAVLERSPRGGLPIRTGEMQRLHAHVRRIEDDLEGIMSLARTEIREQRGMAAAVRFRGALLLGVVLTLGFGVASLGSRALAQSVLRPVRALEEGARRLSEGELGCRVDLHRKDELGKLAATFNRMADRIETSQKALEYSSTHDPLTGLSNHGEFYRALEEQDKLFDRYRRQFALAMVDIDHFKMVNDTYGHRTGDEILRSMARIISREIRLVDKVARYGGEEFAIVLPETGGAEALEMAERLRARIESEAIAVSEGQHIPIRVSIGIAALPEDAGSGEELVTVADAALYAAKREGGNRVRRIGSQACAAPARDPGKKASGE